LFPGGCRPERIATSEETSRLAGAWKRLTTFHFGYWAVHRKHAAAAKLRLRCPQRLLAARAWRSVERDPVVHHSVLMTVLHSGELLVVDTHRAEAIMYGRVLEGDTPALTKFLRRLHRFLVQTGGRSILGFIEHRNFASASPTPEPLHGFMVGSTRRRSSRRSDRCVETHFLTNAFQARGRRWRLALVHS
jgi:hypothetical protein